MPTGIFDRSARMLDDEQYVLHKIRRFVPFPVTFSTLWNSVRKRFPDRRELYDMMRKLRDEGKIIEQHGFDGRGTLYWLALQSKDTQDARER